jgi:hypothetical protein
MSKSAEYARRWRERHPERDRQAREDWKRNNPAGYIFHRAKSRAKLKGIEFSLTIDWVQQRLDAGACEITKLPFCHALGSAQVQNPWSPTIDRKNPNGGYTPDNCRLVVWAFNAAKNVWPDEVVFTLAQALYNKVVE